MNIDCSAALRRHARVAARDPLRHAGRERSDAPPRATRRGCSARRSRCARWRLPRDEITACSSGRKTLTSPLDGLSVPTNAMSSSGQKSRDEREADAGRRSSARSREQQQCPVVPARCVQADRQRQQAGAEQRRAGDDARPAAASWPSSSRYSGSSRLTKPSENPRSPARSEDARDEVRQTGRMLRPPMSFGV